MGIRLVVCFLSEEELEDYYDSKGNRLFELYRKADLEVAHIPAIDHSTPALTDEQIQAFLKQTRPSLAG